MVVERRVRDRDRDNEGCLSDLNCFSAALCTKACDKEGGCEVLWSHLDTDGINPGQPLCPPARSATPSAPRSRDPDSMITVAQFERACTCAVADSAGRSANLFSCTSSVHILSLRVALVSSAKHGDFVNALLFISRPLARCAHVHANRVNPLLHCAQSSQARRACCSVTC